MSPFVTTKILEWTLSTDTMLCGHHFNCLLMSEPHWKFTVNDQIDESYQVIDGSCICYPPDTGPLEELFSDVQEFKKEYRLVPITEVCSPNFKLTIKKPIKKRRAPPRVVSFTEAVKDSWIPFVYSREGFKTRPSRNYLARMIINENQYECEICYHCPPVKFHIYEMFEVSVMCEVNRTFTMFTDFYVARVCLLCFRKLVVKENHDGVLESMDGSLLYYNNDKELRVSSFVLYRLNQEKLGSGDTYNEFKHVTIKARR